MSRLLCFVLLILSAFLATAQYKNDNVLFTTVDPAELCATLEKNKGYLLLDVRSPGEHYDTSSSPGYNLGHLKGAKNINISELGKRLNEIKEYKDQPIFVYCSHSQRSRRAGKMLADSGFTKVFNINGGMTAIHYKGLQKLDCMQSLVETNNNYAIISANELCSRMGKDNSPFILDVRSDSAFRHISRDAKENAFGIIRGAVNIPVAELPVKLSLVPKTGQEIVITDMYGVDAAKAAVLLKGNGYENVSVLIEGIDRILYTDSKDLTCRDYMYISPVTYKMFNATEFGRFALANNNFTLVDLRTKEEFENKHKDYWRNIGHIKNAVHIPADVIGYRLAELDKSKEIVVYGFGTGTEVYATADLLRKNGFTNVTLLVGGIFNLRWSSANVKGQSYLKDMVVDVPEINW